MENICYCCFCLFCLFFQGGGGATLYVVEDGSTSLIPINASSPTMPPPVHSVPTGYKLSRTLKAIWNEINISPVPNHSHVSDHPPLLQVPRKRKPAPPIPRVRESYDRNKHENQYSRTERVMRDCGQQKMIWAARDLREQFTILWSSRSGPVEGKGDTHLKQWTT